MTTPGSVELQQDILVFIDNIFVVVRYDNFDAALLLLGNRLALDAGRDLAVNEILNESADFVMCNLLALVKGEFLVLDSLLDCKGRPLVDFEVEVTGVGAERLGVNSCDVNLALVFLRDGLELFGEGGTLFGGFCEDIAEGNAGLCRISY